MADVSKAGAGILTDLAFNAVVDWLSPVEYDGSALMSLPPTDPRLQPSALLAWEVRNYLRWINELLVPLRKNLASTSARDKLVRFVQYALTVILGAMAMSPRHERQHWLFQALRSSASPSPRQGGRSASSSLVRSYRWSIAAALFATASHTGQRESSRSHRSSLSACLTVCVGCKNIICATATP